MREKLVWVFFVLISLFALESVCAANHVIVNSENWEDVYSTMLYTSLSGIEGDFLTSTAHGPILLNQIPTSKEILLINSRDEPFVFNYAPIVEARDYQDFEEMEVRQANLNLIEELENIENFILVDGSYGYSSIAVTPYAVQTNSWVFIADRVNIAEIEAIMSRRDVDNVILYGYVDRAVRDAMEQYNPKIINNEDRFKDNIEIVEEYLKVKATKQVILSNGEFVERELMNGKHPILFTGRDNVPDQIAEYLKESDIEVGVLIGNELINAATNIRRSTGISVMVKFARGARSQTSGVSAVEGLDLFYLPTPTLDLEIYSIKYNRLSSQIELTYHSKSNVPIYIKGTVTATHDGGRERMGDSDPIFIAPDDYKTIAYKDVVLEGNDLEAEVTTLFGEIPTALDRQLQGTFDLGIINVIDNCEIEVNSVHYVKQTDSFFIDVDNTADVDCYVDIEFRDIRINDREQTIGTEGSSFIKAGRSKKIELEQEMTDEDLEDNQIVDLAAYYGEREEALVHVFRGKFDLNVDLFTTLTWMIIIVVILLIVVLLILLFLRRRDNDEW